MNILDRILESNTTLIGYDAQNDLTVDKIVNFLPSVTVFGRVLSINSNKILEHFNSISHSRDYKLESLLNDKKCNYVIINIGNVYFEEEYDGDNIALKKSMYIKKFISEIQSRLYTLSDPNAIEFKLILLSQLYVTMLPNVAPTIHYKGGTSPVYQSELVIKLLGDKLSIEKDRISSDYNECSIRQELRDISIKSLFNEASTTS